eukprot:9492470-Pyramimonas_sp.AAC.1
MSCGDAGEINGIAMLPCMALGTRGALARAAREGRAEMPGRGRGPLSIGWREEVVGQRRSMRRPV